MSSEIARIVSEFDGHRVVTITHHGRPCWLVQNVGEALGYAPKGLTALIQRDWSSELVRGTDFDVIEGDDLRDLKAALDVFYTTSPNTRALAVLFESGLNLVCLKTDKPGGARLRRLLATEVLPSIARTGAYAAPGAAEVPKLIEAVAQLTALVTTVCTELREARMEIATVRGQLAASAHPHGEVKAAEAAEILAAFRAIATTRTNVDPRKATRGELKAWRAARAKADAECRRRTEHPMGRAWSALDPNRLNDAWESVRRQRDAARTEADQRHTLFTLAAKRTG